MKPNPIETHERRLTVEKLLREGHTQTEIAGILNVNKNTVTKDVKWIEYKL
jgi:DNA-binding CsgD family transcriptional regulator